MDIGTEEFLAREFKGTVSLNNAKMEAEATFSTDNKAAGQTAGEEMKKALEDGFRAAFEETDFELMETQYGEDDAAKSQSIAEN